MATRFYLPISGTFPLDSTPSYSDGSWTRNGENLVAAPTGTTKASTTLTNKTATNNSGETVWVRQGCWVSSKCIGSTTQITGTVSAVVRCLESATNANANLALKVRVIDGTTGAHKATLYSGYTATEYSTSAATRIVSAKSITAYTPAVGDRICIEIGNYISAATSAKTETQRFGDSASSDFALTSGLTTDLNPWVELSMTLTLATVENKTGSGGVTTGGAADINQGLSANPDGGATATGGGAEWSSHFKIDDVLIGDGGASTSGAADFSAQINTNVQIQYDTANYTYVAQNTLLLIVAICGQSDTVTCTDDQSTTYTQILSHYSSNSANKIVVFQGYYTGASGYVSLSVLLNGSSNAPIIVYKITNADSSTPVSNVQVVDESARTSHTFPSQTFQEGAYLVFSDLYDETPVSLNPSMDCYSATSGYGVGWKISNIVQTDQLVVVEDTSHTCHGFSLVANRIASATCAFTMPTSGGVLTGGEAGWSSPAPRRSVETGSGGIACGGAGVIADDVVRLRSYTYAYAGSTVPLALSRIEVKQDDLIVVLQNCVSGVVLSDSAKNNYLRVHRTQPVLMGGTAAVSVFMAKAKSDATLTFTDSATNQIRGYSVFVFENAEDLDLALDGVEEDTFWTRNHEGTSFPSPSLTPLHPRGAIVAHYSTDSSYATPGHLSDASEKFTRLSSGDTKSFTSDFIYQPHEGVETVFVDAVRNSAEYFDQPRCVIFGIRGKRSHLGHFEGQVRVKAGGGALWTPSFPCVRVAYSTQSGTYSNAVGSDSNIFWIRDIEVQEGDIILVASANQNALTTCLDTTKGGSNNYRSFSYDASMNAVQCFFTKARRTQKIHIGIWGGNSLNNYPSMAVLLVRGISANLDASGGSSNSGYAYSYSSPTITTTVDGTFLFSFFKMYYDTGGTIWSTTNPNYTGIWSDTKAHGVFYRKSASVGSNSFTVDFANYIRTDQFLLAFRPSTYVSDFFLGDGGLVATGRILKPRFNGSGGIEAGGAASFSSSAGGIADEFTGSGSVASSGTALAAMALTGVCVGSTSSGGSAGFTISLAWIGSGGLTAAGLALQNPAHLGQGSATVSGMALATVSLAVSMTGNAAFSGAAGFWMALAPAVTGSLASSGAAESSATFTQNLEYTGEGGATAGGSAQVASGWISRGLATLSGGAVFALALVGAVSGGATLGGAGAQAPSHLGQGGSLTGGSSPQAPALLGQGGILSGGAASFGTTSTFNDSKVGSGGMVADGAAGFWKDLLGNPSGSVLASGAVLPGVSLNVLGSGSAQTGGAILATVALNREASGGLVASGVMYVISGSFAPVAPGGAPVTPIEGQLFPCFTPFQSQ